MKLRSKIGRCVLAAMAFSAALTVVPAEAAATCSRQVGQDVLAYGASSATCSANGSTNGLQVTAIAESSSPTVYGYASAYGGVGGAYSSSVATISGSQPSAIGARTITGDFAGTYSTGAVVTSAPGGYGYGYVVVSMGAVGKTCEQQYSGGGYGGGSYYWSCGQGTYVYTSKYVSCYPSASYCADIPLTTLSVAVPACPSNCGYSSYSVIDVTYSVSAISSSQANARSTSTANGTVSFTGG